MFLWLYYSATETECLELRRSKLGQYRSLLWTEMGSMKVRVEDTAKRQAREL